MLVGLISVLSWQAGKKKKGSGEKIHWTSAFSSSLWGAKTANGGCNGVGSMLQLGRLEATSLLVVARKDVMKCVLWNFMVCIVEKAFNFFVGNSKHLEK